MFKNYLKTAWRNLLKNKFYSVINIAGLTAGLAIGILILLWVQYESGFDTFHKETPNIYKLEAFGGTGASRQIWTQMVAPIGPLAKKELPEVKDAVRFTENDFFSLYKYQDKVFGHEEAVFTDPSFFTVFDFPLVAGNPANPFPDDHSVVITQRTAKKFFGDQPALGKVISADNSTNLVVTGVINDFPRNSSIHMDMLMPMSIRAKKLQEAKIDMQNNFVYFDYTTFLLLKPGASIKDVSAKLFTIHIKHKPDDTDIEYLLSPLSKIHLYHADGTKAGIETIRIFTIIALLILVIACINYVNLSTARATLRSKEVSMRKIVGAAKSHLILQFMVETTLLFLLAATLALFILPLLIPVFKEVSGKELVFSLSDSHIWLIILCTITATLAASSIYPALLLSSFEPLKALKGKISAGIGDVLFRKILVTTQFVFSVVLIAGTLVISNQLDFIRTRELGYDKSHVFSFWMRDMGAHYDAVKDHLLKQPGVENVTRASSNIVDIGGITGDNDWDGKTANQTFILRPMAIDTNFISFFKMQLLEGKGFSDAKADSAHFILNEAAIKEIGMKNPIGKRFKLWKTNGTIIGVVKDFHFASMKEKIGPAIFYIEPDRFSQIYIKTRGKEAAVAIAAAQSRFKQYNADFPFGYAFLDDTFNRLYQSEQREGTLFNIFSAIAILISCLGLFGLVAYTAQVRNREIGVRKVLGASVTGIIRLLARDFIRLVFIAILIATPIAWYVMNNWLQQFAYRVSIGWSLFVWSALIVILIALVTLSFQSVKAALANPVKSLRAE